MIHLTSFLNEFFLLNIFCFQHLFVIIILFIIMSFRLSKKLIVKYLRVYYYKNLMIVMEHNRGILFGA